VLLTIVVKSALINKMENGYVTAAASWSVSVNNSLSDDATASSIYYSLLKQIASNGKLLRPLSHTYIARQYCIFIVHGECNGLEMLAALPADCILHGWSQSKWSCSRIQPSARITACRHLEKTTVWVRSGPCFDYSQSATTIRWVATSTRWFAHTCPHQKVI
jgi:hypothetical protein